MNRKTMILMMLVLFAGLTSSGAWAVEQASGDPQGKGVKTEQFCKGKKDFLKGLNLTPEQKQKLDQQHQAARQANQGTRDQLKAKMQELHAEIAKPQTDATKIKDLVADINTLKGNLFSSHVDGILAMKGVLTPEQFSKLEENRKKHGFGKHQGKWAKHYGKGPQSNLGQDPEKGPEEVPGEVQS